MNPTLVYVLNFAIVAAALAGVFMGKITWIQFAALSAVLVTPSAAHVASEQMSAKAKDAQK